MFGTLLKEYQAIVKGMGKLANVGPDIKSGGGS